MGATIQHVEDYYRRMGAKGENTSGMSIFNSKDDRVGRWYSKDGPIKFSREMKNVEDATVVLNRAAGKDNQLNAGPTTNELLNFADSKWKQLRITVPDGRGGSDTYILTAGPNFDREGFKNYVMGRKNTMDKDIEKSYTKAFDAAKARGLSDQAAVTEARYKTKKGGWVKELRKNQTVGLNTRKKDNEGKSIYKKFDVTLTKVRNSESTPVNRQGTGKVPKQLRGSGKNPIRDTTPKPKSRKKKSTRKNK